MDTPRRYECSDVARMAYGACTNDLRPTRRACEKCRFPGVGKGLSHHRPHEENLQRIPARATACHRSPVTRSVGRSAMNGYAASQRGRARTAYASLSRRRRTGTRDCFGATPEAPPRPRETAPACSCSPCSAYPLLLLLRRLRLPTPTPGLLSETLPYLWPL